MSHHMGSTVLQMGFIEAEDAATVKGIVMATKGTSTKACPIP